VALDLSKLDFSNLSDDEKAYIRNTGSPDLMRRAGLMDQPDFDLRNVAGSIQQHELDGDPMPVFDNEGKIALESVGNPDDPRDRVLQPNSAPDAVVPTEPFEGSKAETSGKEQKEPEPDPYAEQLKAETSTSASPKPAATKKATAAPKPSA
jgi:hypothetical protein